MVLLLPVIMMLLDIVGLQLLVRLVVLLRTQEVFTPFEVRNQAETVAGVPRAVAIDMIACGVRAGVERELWGRGRRRRGRHRGDSDRSS